MPDLGVENEKVMVGFGSSITKSKRLPIIPAQNVVDLNEPEKPGRNRKNWNLRVKCGYCEVEL